MDWNGKKIRKLQCGGSFLDAEGVKPVKLIKLCIKKPSFVEKQVIKCLYIQPPVYRKSLQHPHVDYTSTSWGLFCNIILSTVNVYLPLSKSLRRNPKVHSIYLMFA